MSGTAARSAASLALALALLAPAAAPAFAHARADETEAPRAAAASTLSGTVRSLGGAPVAGARVLLRRASQQDLLASTGEDGRFTFADLGAGAATLLAMAGEETAVSFVDLKAGLNEVELTFQRKQLALAVAGPEPQPQATPAPAPQAPAPQTPAQRDAARPPGTEQRQPVPPEARPRPADPTIPPGTERPAPQTPPGAVTRPGPTATPAITDPAVAAPPTAEGQQPGPAPAASPEIDLGNLTQPRPVPPLPSLERLGVSRDDPLSLTLADAIRMALENNNNIEIARDNVRLAESSLHAFQGFYDPFVSLTPQLTHSIRPTATTLSGSQEGASLTTTAFDFDNAFVKPVQFWGGNYQVFFNNTRQTTNNRFTQLSPLYSSSLGVSYTQPLWRNREIDAPRRNIRVQRKRLEQSDAEFRRRTIEIIAQVQRAYWDLVFAIRDEQNQLANLNLTRENFRRTEASVAAGAVAPLERAEVQTELSNREASLLLATQGVSIAENNLKNLLLKDPLSRDWGRAFMPTEQPKFDETPVDLQSALSEARANRPEMRSLRIDEEISDIDLKYYKNQRKPRIDLIGTFSTTGQAGTPVPVFDEENNPIPTNVPENQQGGYFRNLRNVLSLDTRDVVVGVSIQIPIRNRTAEANLATARIQREQLGASMRAQDQLIEVEVRNAAQWVETARRRVMAARDARLNAELQLAGERRLYQVGRSTTFLLFQRENALVNARNQELRAETDYNKALAELQRSTSTTLRANNVFIESPAGR